MAFSRKALLPLGLVASAAALGPRQPALLDVKARVHFIENPRPQALPDIQVLNISTSAMTRDSVMSPNGRSVTVMAFPSAEDQFVSGGLNSGSGWEASYVQRAWSLWQTVGKGKGNFLDVGANVGTWTLPMASAFAGTRSSVIAIEGMPLIADHLRAGISANGIHNVVLFPYAVGDMSRTDQIEMALNPTNKGGSGVVDNMGSWARDAQHFSVGLTTLDAILSVCPALANVFYGKVDIEGNEGRILAGAPELFAKHPPCVIFIELNNEMLTKTGSSRAEVEAQLASLGYDVAGRDGGGHDFQYMQKDMAACVGRLT